MPILFSLRTLSQGPLFYPSLRELTFTALIVAPFLGGALFRLFFPFAFCTTPLPFALVAARSHLSCCTALLPSWHRVCLPPEPCDTPMVLSILFDRGALVDLLDYWFMERIPLFLFATSSTVFMTLPVGGGSPPPIRPTAVAVVPRVPQLHSAPPVNYALASS